LRGKKKEENQERVSYIDKRVDAAISEGQIEEVLTEFDGQLKLEVMLERPLVIGVVGLLAQGHQLLEHGLNRQSLQIHGNPREAASQNASTAAAADATPPALLHVVVVASAAGIASAGITGDFPLVDVCCVRLHGALMLSPAYFPVYTEDMTQFIYTRCQSVWEYLSECDRPIRTALAVLSVFHYLTCYWVPVFICILIINGHG